jgi:hypothetical protein
MFKRFLFVMVLLIVNFATPRANLPELKIVAENRKYYVLFPDGKKVEIVKEHEGGAPNVAILSPDSKYVFYTYGNWIGFESSGKDLYCCGPDGNERMFLCKLGGTVQDVNWIQKDGRNYVLFREIAAGLGWENADLFDFDNRKMILKIKKWELERIEDSECFTIIDYTGKLETGSKICLDSLLTLSDPDRYNVEVYTGYGYPNLLFLSTRREAFLNPESSWPDVPEEEIAKKYCGGLGQCFPSPHRRRSVYCINLDSDSWVGVLNNKTNKFQFSDSINVGKYNFVWSDDGRFLGLVKSFPEDYQEIVVLEFVGDTSYIVKEDIKLKEEKEIELVSWSTRKGGFYYMVGNKEFLKITD